MISGQPYLFVFSWSNLVFSYPFGLLCLDIYLRFCCFRTRLSCSMGSFQNIKSTTTKMTKHSHCFIFSCVFLLPAVSWWEARARLATDWVPSCSPCHVFWMCTWRQLTRRARGVLGWAPSLPNPFQDDFPISCPADCTLGRDRSNLNVTISMKRPQSLCDRINLLPLLSVQNVLVNLYWGIPPLYLLYSSYGPGTYKSISYEKLT